MVDLSADYRTRVVDYMFAEYERGRTPNPDVLCNREIKFDVFLREALKLGADYVATGHYCRKAEETLPDGRTIHKLLAGSDPNKDQSYFLCQLSQEQLSRALFPVGGLLKPEVRRIAEEQGLATAKRKDSQGICFVGKVDLPTFLQQKLAPKKGNIHEILPAWPKYVREEVPAEGEPTTGQLAALAEPWHYTVRDGKKIGEHNGAHYYTIGQRKGLGIGGRRESLFILATDTVQNVIWVGEGVAPRAAHRARRNPLGEPRPGADRRAERPVLRPHPLPPALAGRAAVRPRRRGLPRFRPAPAGHHPRTVRGVVRRRPAGRIGRDRRLTNSNQP